MKNEIWTPKNPTREIPTDIRKYFIEEAKFLHSDLKQNKLSVVLVPAPYERFEGHKIRVVNSRNPEWYSEMHGQYSHFRRDRSLRALNRLRSAEDNPFQINPWKYDMRYRELIFERLVEGYEAEYCFGGRIFFVSPNDKLREFFGLENSERKFG